MAVAKVCLIPGTGFMIINGKPANTSLTSNFEYIRLSKAPLKTLGLDHSYDVAVNTHGGGLRGQADAIKLAVARALCSMAIENRTELKAKGFLTRDARAKERKKYGLRKARKAPQYSKR
jgi:small subunit ribosomal protein S9